MKFVSDFSYLVCSLLVRVTFVGFVAKIFYLVKSYSLNLAWRLIFSLFCPAVPRSVYFLEFTRATKGKLRHAVYLKKKILGKSSSKQMFKRIPYD